ncbi:hypothetical protein OHX14_00025 [Nocardia farcinica]|nr:hypothetical protein [Nocardia farcinica]MCZ9324827.1 hypothetical protein [Nocardia farcinica]
MRFTVDYLWRVVRQVDLLDTPVMVDPGQEVRGRVPQLLQAFAEQRIAPAEIGAEISVMTVEDQQSVREAGRAIRAGDEVDVRLWPGYADRDQLREQLENYARDAIEAGQRPTTSPRPNWPPSTPPWSAYRTELGRALTAAGVYDETKADIRELVDTRARQAGKLGRGAVEREQRWKTRTAEILARRDDARAQQHAARTARPRSTKTCATRVDRSAQTASPAPTGARTAARRHYAPGGGAVTDLVELLVIARIDTTTAVADLFSCQTYYDADTGTETGPGVEAMWETLTVDPAAPICLDSLDQALTTSGYRRTSDCANASPPPAPSATSPTPPSRSPTCPKPAGASQPPRARTWGADSRLRPDLPAIVLGRAGLRAWREPRLRRAAVGILRRRRLDPRGVGTGHLRLTAALAAGPRHDTSFPRPLPPSLRR